MHENNIYWVEEQVNNLQKKYFPAMEEPIQFHATSLRVRDEDNPPSPFNQIDEKTRSNLLRDLYQVANDMYGALFAIVVEKAYLDENQDPYEIALEDTLSRFEQFLRRRYRETTLRNKGLVVVAESQYRERLELLSRRLTLHGTRWVELNNLVDIPFFTLSRNSRLLQIADLIANTVYGRYEAGHTREFDRLMPKFDQEGSGAIHGLFHLCRNRNACYLPCCMSRRITP